jgi:hypothetical protein
MQTEPKIVNRLLIDLGIEPVQNILGKKDVRDSFLAEKKEKAVTV